MPAGNGLAYVMERHFMITLRTLLQSCNQTLFQYVADQSVSI